MSFQLLSVEEAAGILRRKVRVLKLESVVGMGSDNLFAVFCGDRLLQQRGPRGVNCRYMTRQLFEEAVASDPELREFILT